MLQKSKRSNLNVLSSPANLSNNPSVIVVFNQSTGEILIIFKKVNFLRLKKVQLLFKGKGIILPQSPQYVSTTVISGTYKTTQSEYFYVAELRKGITIIHHSDEIFSTSDFNMYFDKENINDLCLAFEIENSIKNPVCFKSPTKIFEEFLFPQTNSFKCNPFPI